MRKYELSISADYVPGWGVTEAVREFFQNSIDEETRDSSNKMLFEYDEAEEKLIIGNCGVIRRYYSYFILKKQGDCPPTIWHKRWITDDL